MASKKNFPITFDYIKTMQQSYISTGTNNSGSYMQKMEIINLICFLTQKMSQANPEKYKTSVDVLNNIFKIDIEHPDTIVSQDTTLNIDNIRSFALICDDLLWGTVDEIPKPEGITNTKEIVKKIYSYFKDEWAPF